LAARRPSIRQNPFEVEKEGNLATQRTTRTSVLSTGGVIIIGLLFMAVAAQKSDAVGRAVNCASSASLTWVKFDILFTTAHFCPIGGVVQRRQTSFGGLMTLVCMTAIVLLAVQLGIDNLTPAFATSITSEPPPWDPHGTFRLVATVHGGGIGSCSTLRDTVLQVKSTASDWGVSALISTSWADEGANGDGSCTITWQCASCAFVSPRAGTLSLVAPVRAWATYIEYAFDMPRMTSSALDANSVSDPLPVFRLEGQLVAPGVTNNTALRGLAEPTVVSLQLTNFMINLTDITRITYQPAISNTQMGRVIKQDQFDFQSADGFQVDFLLSRNSFTIVKYGSLVDSNVAIHPFSIHFSFCHPGFFIHGIIHISRHLHFSFFPLDFPCLRQTALAPSRPSSTSLSSLPHCLVRSLLCSLRSCPCSRTSSASNQCTARRSMRRM
jgi:hypothetical protein